MLEVTPRQSIRISYESILFELKNTVKEIEKELRTGINDTQIIESFIVDCACVDRSINSLVNKIKKDLKEIKKYRNELEDTEKEKDYYNPKR